MSAVLPAILAHTEAEFFEKLWLMDGLAPVIHLDVMDGALVPNTTWFDLVRLHEHRFRSSIELHVMCQDPLDILHQCEELEVVSRFIWHLEAPVEHLEVIRLVRHSGRQTGLAINPSSKLETLSPFIDLVDEVLVMGAEPGFSGKALDTRMIDRAQEIHAHHPELVLGFDIGVNAHTIPQLAKAGIRRFCAASAIFGQADPVKAYQGLLEKSLRT